MTQVKLATPSETVQVLKMLSGSEIRRQGLQHLAESGITEEDVDRLKLEFLTAQDAGRRKFHSAPGILYPHFKPDGQVNGLRGIRFLPGYEPPDPKDPKRKIRYDWPPSTLPDLYLDPAVDWVRVFSDPKRPIGFTEGFKKAVAANKNLDIATMSYNGIWSFQKDGVLLPIYNLIVWLERVVYFFNDADVAKNPESLRAENLHAKLLLERSVERVMVCRYPKNCKVGKLDDALVAKGKKWFVSQVVKKAVEHDPSVASEVPIGLSEEPVVTVASIPPIPKGAMYGVAATIAKELETPISLTYPAVLAMLAAAQLPIYGPTRGTLYTVMLNASGGCKSALTERVGKALESAHVNGIRVITTLPLSDRGLLNTLKKHLEGIQTDAMLPSVLLLLDELRNLFSKAAIENSTIYGVLNQLFYSTSFAVADRKGEHESGAANFNLLGNLPCKNATQFAEFFGAETQEGFYRRCLFGIGLHEEPYTFKPLSDTKLAGLLVDLQRSRLKAVPAMYEHAEKWKQASVDEAQRARRDLLYELLIRVALVTSSANGDKEVTDAAMEAATRFVEWQEKIRTVYTPSQSRTNYAKCMDMVVSYCEGCKGYINWRRVYLARHWNRADFSGELGKVKRDLIENGILVPVPGQKGVYYYHKERED